jgi:CelD/BcsL family acetyltransferase involved in cellulose biosynthesis
VKKLSQQEAEQRELTRLDSTDAAELAAGSGLVPAHEIGAPMLVAEEHSRSELRVVAIEPQSDPRWQDYVALHPEALIYHHSLWFGVLKRTYGYQSAALACEDGYGRLRGVLPLFETQGLLTGRQLVSLPHTPVAGPLADNKTASAALMCAAMERIRARPGTRLQLKTSLPISREAMESGVSIPWEESYVLALPRDPETLRFGNSRNHGRIKWAINKAEKLGVKIRSADNESDLRAWYRLYLETMRWHAVPPRSYRFFATAWEILRPKRLLTLLLAEQNEAGKATLLAGSIFLMFGRTAFYAFNGRRREDLSLRPNDLIQWRAIHDACRDGYQYYDFGEVADTNHGLAEFKTKWGAVPRRYHRFYYPGQNRVATGMLKEDSFIHRSGRNIWRKLPLRITERCGKWIYSHL